MNSIEADNGLNGKDDIAFNNGQLKTTSLHSRKLRLFEMLSEFLWKEIH